jgi:hypothetical protein
MAADNDYFAMESQFSVGNTSGLLDTWAVSSGAAGYKKSFMAQGKFPWLYMHDPSRSIFQEEYGALPNRGMIIRNWDAAISGMPRMPWLNEHRSGTKMSVSTADLTLNQNIKALNAGDTIEVTLEHVIIPQLAEDYYGPNDDLISALKANKEPWEMAIREAQQDERKVTMIKGTLIRRFPAVLVQATGDVASFRIEGGVGFIAVTISNLSQYRGYRILVNGAILDQSNFGNDYWQMDFDIRSKTYELTFNVPLDKNVTFADISVDLPDEECIE